MAPAYPISPKPTNLTLFVPCPVGEFTEIAHDFLDALELKESCASAFAKLRLRKLEDGGLSDRTSARVWVRFRCGSL